jgi:hypothetical protein
VAISVNSTMPVTPADDSANVSPPLVRSPDIDNLAEEPVPIKFKKRKRIPPSQVVIQNVDVQDEGAVVRRPKMLSSRERAERTARGVEERMMQAKALIQPEAVEKAWWDNKFVKASGEAAREDERYVLLNAYSFIHRTKLWLIFKC